MSNAETTEKKSPWDGLFILVKFKLYDVNPDGTYVPVPRTGPPQFRVTDKDVFERRPDGTEELVGHTTSSPHIYREVPDVQPDYEVTGRIGHLVSKFTLSGVDDDGNRYTETADYRDIQPDGEPARTFTVEPAAAQERIAQELGQDEVKRPGFSDDEDCPERRVNDYNAHGMTPLGSIKFPLDDGCISCDGVAARIEPNPEVCMACAPDLIEYEIERCYKEMWEALEYARNAGMKDIASRCLHDGFQQMNTKMLLWRPESERYGPVRVALVGTKRVCWDNFGSYCESIRAQTKKVAKWILTYLGTTGDLGSNDRLTILGRFQPKMLQVAFDAYVAAHPN